VNPGWLKRCVRVRHMRLIACRRGDEVDSADGTIKCRERLGVAPELDSALQLEFPIHG
jgi:hypothetical protein